MIPIVPGASRLVAPSAERKSRNLWVVTESLTVREFTAYDCNERGYWWIPDLGLSMKLGFLLFEDEKSALDQLMVQLRGREAVIKKKISDAEFRLRELENFSE
jgi:hypothetical protein